MATLKEHQAAMVDLLANGSGIPASASRLAHAMHDVLNFITGCTGDEIEKYMRDIVRKTSDATSLGLNDKALSDCVEACRPKATPAEHRVKELENTIRQLKANNAKLRAERDDMTISYNAVMTEMRQLRCDHDYQQDFRGSPNRTCIICGDKDCLI